MIHNKLLSWSLILKNEEQIYRPTELTWSLWTTVSITGKSGDSGMTILSAEGQKRGGLWCWLGCVSASKSKPIWKGPWDFAPGQS